VVPYNVSAECGAEAGVWVASSDDVRGLATRAEAVLAELDDFYITHFVQKRDRFR
jgi:hypothetical protein